MNTEEQQQLAVAHDRYRELVGRAIHGLRCIGDFTHRAGCDPHPLDCNLAGRVSRVFCTGMTRATELCREFGEDPEHNEADRRNSGK
jgi:hypothetical protein